MTHIRAIGHIVGAKSASKQCPEEGSLITGWRGSMEDCFMRRIKFSKVFGDQMKGFMPAQGLIMVETRPQHHRMCKSTAFPDFVIRPCEHLAGGVLAKKERINPFIGSLFGNCFGTVFTVFSK